MKIQLSISLLASNRTGSLERCLHSLKPILQQVPSELIIVHTSDNQEVYQIAKRYTDHIIPFTWCDDFSAARNVGLKEAKGEWFLFLDDDEWFDDVAEICDFFLSGECQKYNSAAYVQKNYLNWQGSTYKDTLVFRMARMFPGTKFELPIHEILTPIISPSKHFSAYVHHYGYLKEVGTATDLKASRNIPMLKQAIKDNPDYFKNYLQIVNEYRSIKDLDHAVEYGKKGLEVIEGKSFSENIEGWLQYYFLDSLFCQKKYDEVIDEANGFLEKKAEK